MEWINNPIVQGTIVALIPVVLPFLVGGIGWLIIAGISLLTAKIKESDTKVDDYLLGIAVKFAEDKFGPDTGKGEEKLHEACDWIEEVTKGRIKSEAIEPLVRAKYVEIFGVLSKSKNG
jgi:hypothetical protein